MESCFASEKEMGNVGEDVFACLWWWEDGLGALCLQDCLRTWVASKGMPRVGVPRGDRTGQCLPYHMTLCSVEYYCYICILIMSSVELQLLHFCLTRDACACMTGSFLATMDGPSGTQEVPPSTLAVDSSGVREISVTSWSCALCLWWKCCSEKRRWDFRPPRRLLMCGLSFLIDLFFSICSCVYTRLNSDYKC